MKLQKEILTRSDASRPTFSARSIRFPFPIHTSANESDQDSFQLDKSKKTRKKRGSAPRSDISKQKFKIPLLELKINVTHSSVKKAWVLKLIQ
ncbi:hypothetical protein AVEN_44440-1 [Araneus ventricosus]|uniref:Uncharacterized protein n=1 Tax=Araneus ventricosus TaxID=182803 RepID=A0A4Y2GJ92_ARAVE|nr:hypothetical protein AVEN_44440-1 [Araneus ventricosus]